MYWRLGLGILLLAAITALAIRPIVGPGSPTPPEEVDPPPAVVPVPPVEPAPAELHLLRVRTLDPLGRPVPEVRIAVLAEGNDLSHGIADADGSVSLEVGPGPCRAVIRDRDWYGVSPPVVVPEDESVTIWVGRGLPLSVEALDDAGAPVVGARILVDNLHTAVTGDDGRASLAAVDPGGVWVRVESDDHVNSQAYVRPARTPTYVTRLVRGGRLTVHVIEEDATPVPGAHLFIVYDPARVLHVDTDERGVAVVAGMAAAPHVTVGVTSRDARRAELRVPIAPGTAEKRVEIRMPEATIYDGVVVEAETGAPIGGALLHVWGDWGRLRTLGETDEAGRFRVRTSDRIVFWATAPGFAMAEMGTEGARIEMVRTASLRGRIVSAEGAPVAGVHVAVAENTGRPNLLEARSGPDGRFEIGDVPPEDGWIKLRSPGRPTDSVYYDTLSKNETRDLGDLRLSRLFTLRATVADDSGRPVPMGWIEVTGVAGDRVRRPILDGRFVPIPRVRIYGAYATVTAPGLLVRAGLRLTPDTDHIVLERRCSISGRLIRKGTNLPLAGVAILFEQIREGAPKTSGWFVRGRTDEHGNFHAAGLCRGKFLVIVKELKIRGEVEVVTGHRDVGTITLSD